MTIYDIAKELNIAASTVSRALNDNPRISKKTRALIQETARKMGYKPNQVALALRKGNSKTIGVIVPFVDREFFGAVLSGIEEVFNESGHQIILCQSHDNHENEIENVDTLLGAKVSGIIVSVAPGKSYHHLQKVAASNIPLVMFDRVNNQVNTSSVKVDDFKGAYQAVTHLLDQGYKNIAHFHGDLDLQIYEDRMNGYIKALSDHSIDINPGLIFGGDCFVEIGEELTKKLLNSGHRFDAIFASSDYKAIGAVKALKAEGFSIPEDIGVAGFCNAPFVELLDLPISTVDQRPKEMGVEAAKSILELLSKGNDPEHFCTTVLDPTVIPRASTCKKSVVYKEAEA